MFIMITFAMVSAYISVWIGVRISSLNSNFVPSQGLWRLVPFRVSGWRSVVNPTRVYIKRWAWERWSRDNYYDE